MWNFRPKIPFSKKLSGVAWRRTGKIGSIQNWTKLWSQKVTNFVKKNETGQRSVSFSRGPWWINYRLGNNSNNSNSSNNDNVVLTRECLLVFCICLGNTSFFAFGLFVRPSLTPFPCLFLLHFRGRHVQGRAWCHSPSSMGSWAIWWVVAKNPK